MGRVKRGEGNGGEMGEDGAEVRGELLKIFPFPSFPLILRVNKMRVKYFPLFSFLPFI